MKVGNRSSQGAGWQHKASTRLESFAAITTKLAAGSCPARGADNLKLLARMVKAGIPRTWARNKQNHQLWLSLRNSTASNLPVDTAMIHGCPWNSGFRTHDKGQQDGGMQGHVLDRRSNCAFIRNNGKQSHKKLSSPKKLLRTKKLEAPFAFRAH